MPFHLTVAGSPTSSLGGGSLEAVLVMHISKPEFLMAMGLLEFWIPYFSHLLTPLCLKPLLFGFAALHSHANRCPHRHRCMESHLPERGTWFSGQPRVCGIPGSQMRRHDQVR